MWLCCAVFLSNITIPLPWLRGITFKSLDHGRSSQKSCFKLFIAINCPKNGWPWASVAQKAPHPNYIETIPKYRVLNICTVLSRHPTAATQNCLLLLQWIFLAHTQDFPHLVFFLSSPSEWSALTLLVSTCKLGHANFCKDVGLGGSFLN